MFELILMLAGIVVAFLLFFWGAATYTGRVFSKIAAHHVADTEWIVDTGIAPLHWSEPQKRRIARLEAAGADAKRLGAAKARFREWHLARLERHLRYLERATLFRSERERHALTDRIRAIGKTWEAARWEQIVGEETFD